jgi:hypothetical protein
MKGAPYPRGALIAAIDATGHAVARLVLNDALPDPGPPISIVAVELPGIWESYVGMNPRVGFGLRPLATPDVELACDVVELIAGPVATMLHRRGPAGLRIYRERHLQGETDPCSDGWDASAPLAKAEWLAGSAAREVYRAAWHVAVSLIEAEWLAIVKTAHVLRSRGRLSGREFEATWRGFRVSPVSRTAEAVRMKQAVFERELAAYLEWSRSLAGFGALTTS